MQALIQKTYDGRNLDVGRSLPADGDYRRNIVTWEGDGLKLSGVMNVPRGDGPFPVVVMNHGYIDPDVYVPGQGMRREHDYLTRQGYAIFHVDYRGYASSDDDEDVDYELRLPYAVDVINAVKAIKGSDLDYLDKDRIGYMGRSLGGSVTLNALVAQPGLVDAAVIYATTSSVARQNFRTFYLDGDSDRSDVVEEIEDGYGLPEDNPEFWRNVSPKYSFDRITTPLQVHHGEQDDTCPIAWSEDIVDTLEDLGKEVEYFTYPGEGHRFEAGFQRSIERTERFFEENLR